MDEQTKLLEEITKMVLYKLCDYTPEQLRAIRDHMEAPDGWVKVEELNQFMQERTAMMDDLHSTCGICASPDIIHDDVLDGYQCAHMDRQRIVGFGRRTEAVPPRCPHWVWRGAQGASAETAAQVSARSEVLA